MHKLKAMALVTMLALTLPALAGGTAATLYLTQKDNGVPTHLAGCHTTKIGPYVFEGHIPVESVKRVLKERRFIKGISVPGMPAGSPGMSGAQDGPLMVYLISPEQPPKIYATH